MFKYELGSTVKSDLTGFKGILTANSIHMNGCNRCWIQPKVDKDGKIPDGCWVDEPELELVSKPKVKREKKPAKTGGFHSSIK
jgi:hypothetical protein